MKILFVDDDHILREMVSIYLDSENMSYYMADSGLEAINILSYFSNNIDLIFLDLMMPNKNGYDVLKYLNENNFNIDVIVQTGVTDVSDLLLVKKLGAKEIFLKPYPIPQLISSIKSFRKKKYQHMNDN